MGKGGPGLDRQATLDRNTPRRWHLDKEVKARDKATDGWARAVVPAVVKWIQIHSNGFKPIQIHSNYIQSK
jgi:hypothetical protein